MGILDKMNNQPEFRMPIWDYLAALVDDERVAEGKAKLALHKDTLDKVAIQYGVDAATVVAVWGVESNFGQTFGKYPLTQALGTLSCFGPRQTYFRGEFFAALRILQAGHIAPERLVGSWAGAFGHTQFMPTTFERLAQDFDGDGRRDIWRSSTDALASIDTACDETSPSTTNLLGAKGAGEGGSLGAPPAVVSAVVDALRGFGVSHLDMPLWPEKIWHVMRESKTSAGRGGAG
jgi:hypothetical protein